jgi:dTDP-4-amino-4,6-dideoxygalactose transaminase
MAKMKAKGIPTMVYYPTPMSKQTAFKEVHSFALTPHAEKLSKSVLSLPMHPYLTREDVRTVAENLINSL